MSGDSDCDKLWKLIKEIDDADFEKVLKKLWWTSSVGLAAKKQLVTSSFEVKKVFQKNC